MTTKTAIEWPTSFLQRNDPFPQNSVRGTIGRPASVPGSQTNSTTSTTTNFGTTSTRGNGWQLTTTITAGPKPGDVVVKEERRQGRGGTTYVWVNKTTGATYYSHRHRQTIILANQ
jgi:hypothetical protein